MQRTRFKVLTGRKESSKHRAAECASAEIGEGASKPGVIKLFSLFVSVPQPSKSKFTSDGKIQHFSFGRSRSSSRDGECGVRNCGWIQAELYLTHTTLCYELVQPQRQTCEIFLEDLIGVHIGHTSVNDVKTCQLVIHYFPLVTKKWAMKRIRRLVETTIRFDMEKEYEDNVRIAGKWKTRIVVQAERATQCIFEQGGNVVQQVCSASAEVDEEHGVSPRNLLVFINPMAGTQKGESDFNQYVKPMFDLAEINYVIVVTECQNHAHELIQELNLKKFTGIVISSGDGLLYEIINGLMKRTDWEEVIKIPIGMVPTGSGNALAASTLHESKEHFSLETAAFQIIRGGFTPLDLATVHTSDGNTTYMTLLASWGIVADVDIESENMRRLGEARFILGALNSIRKKRVYKGKLSYLVADNACQEPVRMILQQDLLDEPGERGIEFDKHENCLKSTGSSEAVRESSPDGSSSSDSHKDNCMPVSRSRNGSVDVRSHDSASEGASAACALLETMGASATCAQLKTPVEIVSSSYKVKPFGPPTDLLVPLRDPLPDNWITIDADYLGVIPLMITHLARAKFGDANFQLGSGKIRLMWIDGSITKLGALKMFKNIDTGKHVQMEEVNLIDVKAFRIEPETPNGMMTVDGERMSYGPMQAQIHPHMVCVMSRKRCS